MEDILRALGDPAVRSWYLYFCLALMVLPMIGLAIWYHSGIRKTEGGRRLMERQADSASLTGSPQALANLPEAARMAADIAAGKYGGEAKRMQGVVYWICGFWVLACAVAFGILIWADEVNRAAG